MTLGHVQIFNQILANDRGFAELLYVLKCDLDCSLPQLSEDDCQLDGSVSSASMWTVFIQTSLLSCTVVVDNSETAAWIKKF